MLQRFEFTRVCMGKNGIETGYSLERPHSQRFAFKTPHITKFSWLCSTLKLGICKSVLQNYDYERYLSLIIFTAN